MKAGQSDLDCSYGAREIMEHIDPTVSKRYDVRSGRACQFCKQFDPEFPSRKPMDQMVLANRQQHSAAAHLTEDGYVRHRMTELSNLVAVRKNSSRKVHSVL